jgi:hypothetical protein
VDEHFERDLRVGLAELLDPVVESHPRWEGSPAAERVLGGPARAGLFGRLGLAWAAVLAALLLVGLLAAALFVGAWRPAIVTVPAPPTATTVVGEASDILATAKARPLPAQATCPPGSDPDALGPVDQDRPTGGSMAFDRHAGRIVLYDGSQTWTYDVCTNAWQRMHAAAGPVFAGDAALLYDADSDRVLAFGNEQQDSPVAPSAAPATEPATEVPASAAPGEGDLPGATAGVAEAAAETNQDEPDGQSAEPSIETRAVWSYDLAADRWTKVGWFPWVQSNTANPTYGTTFYHDPSGLAVLYDGAAMWAYDVDTNALSKVRQLPDPAQPAAAGLPNGKIAFGYDPGRDLVVAVVVPYSGGPGIGAADLQWGVPSSPWGETWTFDPGSGTWRLTASPAPSDLIVCTYWRASTDCWPTNGRAVFDEASGTTVFFNRDNGGAARALATPGRIDAYDAGRGAWRTLRAPVEGDGSTPNWCGSMPPVYDPLNRRIVCLSSADEPIGAGVSYPFAGVWAFSTATGESRWLLAPDATRCDVSTLAGTPGEAGAADGAGTAARFSQPRSIVVDRAGALYITDTGNDAIRKMTADGTVTTFAGRLGEPGSADGVGSGARFEGPTGLAIDASGTLYVTDTGNDAIREVAPDGTVTTLAEDLGISPVGIAVGGAGTVFAGGLRGNVILQIAPDGTVSTLAGERGLPGWTDGQAAAARLEAPLHMWYWADVSALYVVDTASDGARSVLRTVGLDGTVSTMPGEWAAYGQPGSMLIEPSGAAIDLTSAVGDTIIRAEFQGPVMTIVPTLVIAGVRGEAGYQDGRGAAARFRGPTDIVRDASGLFYIVDSENSVIRTMSCRP